MNIDDIEGAKPAQKKHVRFATRDILKIDDIEGAKPVWEHAIGERKEGYGKPYNYDPFNYRDVTHAHFVSSKHTNPLAPQYTVRNEDNKPITIGPVDGDNTVCLPAPRKDQNYQDLSLKT